MSKVSENVIGRIKQDGIKPISKLYFIIREILFWISYIFILVLGAFLFSAILELLFGRSFEILSFSVIWERFLNNVPAYWIMMLIVFLFAGLYVNRRIGRAYRFQKRVVLIAEALFILLFGIVFYSIETGLFVCGILGK